MRSAMHAASQLPGRGPTDVMMPGCTCMYDMRLCIQVFHSEISESHQTALLLWHSTYKINCQKKMSTEILEAL